MGQLLESMFRVLRFNQDATCCAVSPASGTLAIYNCDPFGMCYEYDSRANNDSTESNEQHSSQNTSGRRGSARGYDDPYFQDSQNTQTPPARVPLAKRMSLTSNAYTGANTDPSSDRFIAEMLFSTSLIAISDKSQGPEVGRRLKIVNIKKKSVICELLFPAEIIQVVMNRKRMCILLGNDQIHIYDVSCMKSMKVIDIWQGYKGENINLSRLSSHSSSEDVSQTSMITGTRRGSVKAGIFPKIALTHDDRSILCYSSYSASKSKPGTYILRDIVIYDALNVKPINYLNMVHKGNISSLAINEGGKLIATASERGTIIRVFKTGIDTDFDSANPLQYEMRRGTRPCNIYQLVFNHNSTLLGCVGDTDTIHIFKLTTSGSETMRDLKIDDGELPTSPVIGSARQFASYFSTRIKASLPNQNLRRDFVHIDVNSSGRYVLGFPEEYPNVVYVADDSGSFSIYTLPSSSGECVLTKASHFNV